MSFDGHLIHTCTIENPTTGQVNAYNNAKPAFDAPVENVRCRLVEKEERVWSDELQAALVKTVYHMLIGSGVSLLEKGKISKVTLENGTVMNDTFLVEKLLMRRGKSARHQTAILERISSGSN